LDEGEAYWTGLVVGTIMLSSGFSLLLIPTYTGYGAVILSLGVMTMIVVLMTKALITQIQKWMDYNARIEETVSTILTLKTEGVVIPSKAEPEPQKTSRVEEEEELPVEAAG